MKREIKFRAWLKAESKICAVGLINFGTGAFLIGANLGADYTTSDGKSIVSAPTDGRFCNEGEYELMQFTGLKDKNGKEIFESDILMTETDKPMVVTWSNKFASFCLNRDGWAFQHWFGEACNPENCEAIGNIYETPELLKL